eukprot:GFYU01014777.1.p1 GENE.GFYU01014777.1~~GFYU01014777.1.p1  ORF type:complete len:314 (-),score=73.51 GFYU01014777.1:17-958(-)
MMAHAKTMGYAGYSVEFSPFEEHKVACAAAQHYGIIGNGKLFIYENPGGAGLVETRSFDTQDGLYDCTWSEENENYIATGSGDGSIKLWDLSSPANPARSFQEHSREVYSVDWNLVSKDTFVSGSWDESIKVWNPNNHMSLTTYREHKYCIYATVWSPRYESVFASASGDYTLKIWDVNQPRSVQTINAHDQEILTCDWNKYSENVIATGSVDKTVKLWDLRNVRTPMVVLHGHEFAVRRIKFSPHSETALASVSYDMSTIIWDTKLPNPMVNRMDNHTEFVVGLDWNLFIEGQVATCGWDENVFVSHQPVPQ